MLCPPKGDLRPVPFTQDLEARNIHIKRYEDIPLADTEIIFPDKKIYIKPITVIQLFITILGGIVAALVTVWNVRLPDIKWHA